MGMSEIMEKNINVDSKTKGLNELNLSNLLRTTKDAHHIYKEGLGESDENWLDWYAQYMADQLHNQLTKTDLLRVLGKVAQQYDQYAEVAKKSGQPIQDWSEWYAKHMLDEFDNEEYR